MTSRTMLEAAYKDKRKRFKSLVHYVCGKCPDPTKLGATKLNKALWYSDTFAFRRFGKTISGETTYIKRQFGPVPKQIRRTIMQLEAEGALKVREMVYFGKPKRVFISLKDADASVFSADERQIVDQVVETICNEHTAASISDLSHDLILEAAMLGEEIPVFAVLAARAAAVRDEDEAWADKIISSREATKGKKSGRVGPR